jgi:hypothetical protein
MNKSRFNFGDYLSDAGWNERDNGIFAKNFKTIKLLRGETLMIAMNFDERVKHKHIATCIPPFNEAEAEMLMRLTMLDKD